MTLQLGKQVMAIHILPSISKSKGNQTIKFGQLIEYNLRNIFLEKSYTKYGGKTIPRPFSEKSKSSISLDQQSKILYSLLLLNVQVEGYRNTLKRSCRPLAFTTYKTSLQNKRGLGLVSLPHFLHNFWRIVFLLLHFTNWPNFIFWLPLLLEILGNTSVVIDC